MMGCMKDSRIRAIRRLLWWLGLACLLPTALTWIAYYLIVSFFSGLPQSCDATKVGCSDLRDVIILFALIVVGYLLWIIVGIMRVVSADQEPYGIRLAAAWLTMIGMSAATLPNAFIMSLIVLMLLDG